MAVDVRVNSVSTTLGVVDRSALLSPEVLEMVVAAVKARLADEARIASERARDTHVDHRDR
ncbi:MAG TPA: hypothetical protein VF645_13000 [Allosphingosinicella sp.]|jgi:hypothetical protein